MSPSPATGLSKGEREREINSTSFGECKTVPRMYLCLVMSCSGVIAALWRGAHHHQGSLAGPCAKVGTEGQSLALLSCLDGLGSRGWVNRVPVPFVSLPTVVHQRGCITHLSCHSQNSSYHFCSALQMVWLNLGQADCC